RVGLVASVAVLFAIASLFVLVAFFHHLASGVRVEEIIDAVHDETLGVVEEGFPRIGADDRVVVRPEEPCRTRVVARTSGRVRWLDEGVLCEVARAAGGTIVMERVPGDYVDPGEPLAALHGGRPLDRDEQERVHDAFSLGSNRNLSQDVSFGIRQLVDIALRALSPSLQDPSTAEEAMQRVGDVLRRLANRELGARVEGGDGRVLLSRPRPTWADFVQLGFDQMRGTAESQADAWTMRMLLTVLTRVLAATDDAGRQEVLRVQGRLIVESARRSVPAPVDLARVEEAAVPLLREEPAAVR
ncbi:MAG TPA: DUF2254 family protein, partial [Miltoncostaeaceae bacterium]|nr:DUF2254 family protein [Miltoncostaeaceae bacterium]